MTSLLWADRLAVRFRTRTLDLLVSDLGWSVFRQSGKGLGSRQNRNTIGDILVVPVICDDGFASHMVMPSPRGPEA